MGRPQAVGDPARPATLPGGYPEYRYGASLETRLPRSSAHVLPSARPTTTATTRAAPACFSTRAAEPVVVPVVRMSSTRKTVRPLTRAASPAPGTHPSLASPARRVRACEDVRRTHPPQDACLPEPEPRPPRASPSAWLYPRLHCRFQCNGTGTTGRPGRPSSPPSRRTGRASTSSPPATGRSSRGSRASAAGKAHGSAPDTAQGPPPRRTPADVPGIRRSLRPTAQTNRSRNRGTGATASTSSARQSTQKGPEGFPPASASQIGHSQGNTRAPNPSIPARHQDESSHEPRLPPSAPTQPDMMPP